jgi:pilus assembly protein CpaF
MANDSDEDGLLGLFSTRGAKGGKRATTLLLPEGKGNEGGSSGVSAPSITQMPPENRNQNHHSSSSGANGSEISALANTILRETRRELGSDYNLQQAQKAGLPIAEEDIVNALNRVLSRHSEPLSDIEKANIVIHLQKDLLGWGILQPLIDNREVTDIHVYDYRTVVLQRGKKSETTGLNWPNHQSYKAFVDRLLLRLGKSLTTQNHTVDAALPNGIRICAVHESVCGQRGPLLSLRVPRVMDIRLENLVTFQMAPPLAVNYLAALTRSGRATIMVAGETGTGKTTVVKCLGTQFGPDESIVAVEDTPELNFSHPYFRSLISRPPNTEGIGEVTLQEHIKTTLRMTPTRVILGEMRTPFAAEAFLESAQTGHVGMSTIHARNAKETLTRLESLLGRAQKSVSVEIIRQQISLAVDCVVWLFREKGSGKPRIGEVIEVGHYVEGAIQVKPMFRMIQTGDNPLWRLESWNSYFDSVLIDSGITLGDSPKEFGFGATTSQPYKSGR